MIPGAAPWAPVKESLKWRRVLSRDMTHPRPAGKLSRAAVVWLRMLTECPRMGHGTHTAHPLAAAIASQQQPRCWHCHMMLVLFVPSAPRSVFGGTPEVYLGAPTFFFHVCQKYKSWSLRTLLLLSLLQQSKATPLNENYCYCMCHAVWETELFGAFVFYRSRINPPSSISRCNFIEANTVIVLSNS